MLWVLLASTIAASSASPKPFGLTWGTPMTEATVALSKRLQAESELGQFTFYAGDFGRFSDVRVQANYFRSKLAGVVIMVPRQGQVHKSTTWREAVEMIAEKYGKPKAITEPPTSMRAAKRTIERAKKRGNKAAEPLAEWAEAMDEMEKSPDLLDQKIETKEWKPKAEWAFKDKSIVRIISLPDVESDQELGGSAAAIIVFGGPDLMKALEEESKAHPDDF